MHRPSTMAVLRAVSKAGSVGTRMPLGLATGLHLCLGRSQLLCRFRSLLYRLCRDLVAVVLVFTHAERRRRWCQHLGHT